MQISKNKLCTTLLLCLLIIAMMPLIVNSTAHTPPYQITTYAKITIQPEVIGIGQSAMGYAFLGNAPLPGSSMNNQYRSRNYTVWITNPDGKVTTLHWDIVDDTTGCQMFRFTPDVEGQYNVTFTFGGMTLTSADTGTTANIGDVYLPSTATCTFYAQAEPIANFPDSYPLPTEYWTRPIYGENPGWFKISSSWLGTGAPVNSKTGYGTISGTGGQSVIQRYPGDAIGPKTGHVMWTKPMQSGGVVGGDNYDVEGQTFFEGSAYINRFQNPIIVAGMLIYREPLNFASASGGDTVCVDLTTGKENWRSTTMPAISFAYMPDMQNPNQHGVFPPLLVTSNWGQVFDAYTGYRLFNVTNVPTGTLVQGPNGEHIRYTLYNNGTTQNPDWYLCMWNSTLMWAGIGFHPGETQNTPTIQTQTVNGVTAVLANQGRRYNWIDTTTQNKSIPWRSQAQYNSFTVIAAYYNNIMLCRSGAYPALTGATHNVSGVVTLDSANWTYFAIDLDQSHSSFGQILWTSPTYSSLQDKTISWAGSDPTAKVFAELTKETTVFTGYSMNNGQKLWETEGQTTLDYFGNPSYPYAAAQEAYGRLYSLNYGGLLYCYNLTNGKLLWTYGNGGPGNSTQSGLQVPGYYPGFIMGVGDDIVYIAATQHTITTPIPKGNYMRGINATTGEEIWTISDYTGTFTVLPFAMADGYCTYFNGYDNQIYALGKGPTSLTVTAPDLSADFGQPVVIRGTVHDVSTGTKQDELTARFANGVAVASDASMAEWMGYLYQNKPRPTNFTGVEVTIYAIDANNNYRPIGTTTTDTTGAYNLIWQPDIPGTYLVTAAFAGTNGYWGSSATTAFNVMEEKTTPAPTESPRSMADEYFIPAVTGIILAIILVGIATIVLQRKRP
ncbi:MAG: PQQ-like beta-propeller repeat protein [Nitrososphaerota archaeon]|nr:PQQ-like beta-propeller repeat protein [Nitrososphaerota archaeon]